MENYTNVTYKKFLEAAKEFVRKSDDICDQWKMYENTNEIYKTYIKKETFISTYRDNTEILLKAEFVIYYNLSYGTPSFSFNIWDSSGVLLSLEEIRKMTFIQLSQEEFYSTITQQEHPLFFRPYFIMHPCHTESLLSMFKDKSKNIIVTFLGLITPLLKIDLPLKYGL